MYKYQDNSAQLKLINSSNILLKFPVTQFLVLCYAGRYASSPEFKKRTVGIG